MTSEERLAEANRYADVVGIPAPVRRAALEHLAMMGDEGHWVIETEDERQVQRVRHTLEDWAAGEVGSVQVVDREVVATGTVALRLRAYLTRAGKLPEAPGWLAEGRVLAFTRLAPEVKLPGPVPLARLEVQLEVTAADGHRVYEDPAEGLGTAPVPGKMVRRGNVRASYLLKALELARVPGGVQAKDLAAEANVTVRHARRVLEALAAEGAVVRETGPVPHKRSPGKAPLVYRVAQ